VNDVRREEGWQGVAGRTPSRCDNQVPPARPAEESGVAADLERPAHLHSQVAERPRRACDQIVLIDDQTFIRECVTRSLQMSYDTASVASFAALEDFAAAAPDATRIAFIMFNIHQRRPSSPEVEQAMTQLKNLCPASPVIILSDIESLDRIREAIELGARGFIPTSATLDVVVGATQLVWAGGTFVPASSLVVTWTGVVERHATGRSASDQFTQRQLAVLHLLRQGKANKTIAHELEMSESTVKIHVRNIMKKLKATNRTQAVFLTRDLFGADIED
jgi:DNA-binding NarL/FixJ family response regulator